MNNFTPINRLIVMAPPASLLTASSQLPVLLVFAPTAPTQRAGVDQLLAQARSVLERAVRIVRISETTHPEVVLSFGFTTLPAFVLLRQGLELWRHTGPIDSHELFHQLGNQIDPAFLRTH